MAKNNSWFDDNTQRDPHRLIKDMRNAADKQDIRWSEDWNGSHNITRFEKSATTRSGMAVVPTSKRQVAKGTWGSLKRTLKMIGLLTIVILILIVLV